MARDSPRVAYVTGAARVTEVLVAVIVIKELFVLIRPLVKPPKDNPGHIIRQEYREDMARIWDALNDLLERVARLEGRLP